MADYVKALQAAGWSFIGDDANPLPVEAMWDAAGGGFPLAQRDVETTWWCRSGGPSSEDTLLSIERPAADPDSLIVSFAREWVCKVPAMGRYRRSGLPALRVWAHVAFTSSGVFNREQVRGLASSRRSDSRTSSVCLPSSCPAPPTEVARESSWHRQRLPVGSPAWGRSAHGVVAGYGQL